MNYDDFVPNEDSFLKKQGKIFISDVQNEILKKYDFDVNKYNDIQELIYDIEELLNTSNLDMEDLEWVSSSLAEYNYYNNTNK